MNSMFVKQKSKCNAWRCVTTVSQFIDYFYNFATECENEAP